MNFYQQELNRIKSICYSNEAQIKTVIRTRKFIENNFDKELDLNLLSHTQFTSKFHLLRLFKKYYGVTPKQYLIDKRIEKSKQYLKNGMTVTETCFAVGFESPSSFSTLFKSKIGVSPIEFQKKQFSQSNLKLDLQTCTSQF
ncbi:AraC family transcriptional regulator [Flavobacterium sp. KJJ]|uniref:helix-turn-helix domain-containing protein n=1 Tax=Flavobacterium sp. KJJ TaxID=1270193 RepID=UPI000493060A|nr:AraC family transcriptional regulator [Flavobacterium sp. KJJ]